MLMSALLRRWSRRFCAVIVTFALAIVGPATIAGAATFGCDVGQPGFVDIGASGISDRDAFAYDVPTEVAEIPDVGPAGSVAPVVNLASAVAPAAGTTGDVCHAVESFAAPTAAIDDVLPKPVVSNTKLQNIVNDLYKGTTNPNRVGTGTTADAVRNELATGLPTGGKFHSEKAQIYINGLNNVLKQDLTASDRLVAQSLLDDLVNALGGAP